MFEIVELAKSLVTKAVKPGDAVVDATVGKGRDTALLAQLVGENGLVYGFDIQQQAIDIAQEYLDENGLGYRVKLICDGHEHIDRYITRPVKAVMFNLGYLPGGDHRIKTTPETTVEAVGKSLKLLEPGGIITIAVYTGHPGGKEEKQMLRDHLSKLEPSNFRCIAIETFNQGNRPPILFAVEKRN
jgi:predicted methyltransferase